MKLKKLEVRAYAGISPNSPVVIDFTQSNFVKASGDFGVGKTSLLDAMLTACGQLSKDDKDKINLESGKIDIDFEFVGNDRKNYQVRCTKSAFKLTCSGESVSEPIAMMRELLGGVGQTPMAIKEAKLKDIIKWLAGYSNKSAEEFDADMLKFKEGIKDAEKSRADANRSLKGLNEYLGTEEMFADWEDSEKKYKVKPNIEKLAEEQQEAGKKSDQLVRAVEKVKQKIERKISIEAQIAQLRVELSEVDTAITEGEKFVEKNKNAGKEYDEVSARYKNAAKDLADYNLWQEIKRKKKERDEFETAAQLFDTMAKDLQRDRKIKQSEILPDIKGVELVTDDVTEDGVFKREGLYYNGKNVHQISETEWWSLVMLIWRKYKVKVIVIDNMQSLGSKGVELLEKLSADGAYILAAEMNRETKTLEVSYE